MSIRQQLLNQEANARLVAQLAGTALDHLRQVIDASDGYGTQSDGGSGKNNISDPTGNAVLRKGPHWIERQIITDYLDDRETADAAVIAVLMRYRTPIVVPRCGGAIDPTCTNASSDHHDPVTGATSSDLCDACWLIACRKCHRKPPEAHRNGLCTACSRAAYRDKAGVA